MLKTVFIRIIFLLLLSLQSQAAEIKNMYEVTSAVLSQDKTIRMRVFEQAFIEVLVRVSGHNKEDSLPDAGVAAKYVQQYRYLPLVEQAKTNSAQIQGTSQPKHLLWVQFNPALIKQLLKKQSLPIWGLQRPNVLVWLAVRDGRHRYVLKDRDQSVIKEALEKQAERRGLPVIWPKYDEVDQLNVQFADLWGGFWAPISTASERYGVDAILLGRMSWQKDDWQIDWSLQLLEQRQDWLLRASDLPPLMASGIDITTDRMASQFSILESNKNSGRLSVQINGIHNVANYAQAGRYLASLAMVKNVSVVQVEAGNILFNIDMTGDQDDFQRLIQQDKVLQLDTSSKDQPEIMIESDSAMQIGPESRVMPSIDDVLNYRFIDS